MSMNISPEHLHFVVLAIEAAAKKMGISPSEVQRRLKKQGLIENLLVKHYDVFHTMRLEHVAEDTVDALLTWEKNTQETEEQS